MKNGPAISLIIPMYNAEKYIGECLDSILAQTFQDFEVIVIDNCSTDDSVKIVESYAEKFTNGGGYGKFTLIKRKFNSGGPAIPRNNGIKFSRGEYVFFLDSDDALFPTAFEKLYTTAKEFNADEVSLFKDYSTLDENITFNKTKLQENIINPENPITVPTLESEDLAVRVKKFSEGKINWGPPAQFVRRELIWEKELTFPKMTISDDFVFAFFVLCTAKNFVYLPDAVHIYRIRPDSLFHGKKNLLELIHKRFGDFFVGMEAFEKFMSKFELFQKQPEYKYMLFDFFARNCGIEPIALNLYSQFSAAQLDNAIRAELEQIEETTGLTTYLFSRMSIFNLKLYQYTQIINRQQAQIQQLQAQLQQK